MSKFTSKTAAAAGRKSSRKGVPNRVTKPMREAFKGLLEDNTEKMQKWLDRVAKEDPAKALELMYKFADYFMPKLTRTEVKEVTSLEELMKLTPEKRTARIIELQKKLTKDPEK